MAFAVITISDQQSHDWILKASIEEMQDYPATRILLDKDLRIGEPRGTKILECDLVWNVAHGSIHLEPEVRVLLCGLYVVRSLLQIDSVIGG
jgi:hypothetical protein